MRWIDKLERRYGRYGIPNLLNGVLIGQIVAWVIVMFINSGFYNLLPLTRDALMQGQIWRLVSFIFVPPLTTSPLSLLFQMYFYWWVGSSLQRAWGDFRFTFYWVVGMLGAVIGALITGGTSTYGLFLSLFFAYAWMWPEQQVLLFFILPIKIKWMGWAALALWVVQFITSSMAVRVSLLFGLAGFVVFFGAEIFDWAKQTVLAKKRRRDWQNKWK